jgi:hypothetical protein
MLENLLENLFGKNYDMENKVLSFTQMSVLRQLRYLVQVEDALSIGDYQGTKQKA